MLFLIVRNRPHPLLQKQIKAHLEPSGRRRWLIRVQSFSLENSLHKITLNRVSESSCFSLSLLQYVLYRMHTDLSKDIFLFYFLVSFWQKFFSLQENKAFLSLLLFPWWHEVFNHNQFADNVVLVSCVCLSVSSPVPDCQMHALDNVDTLVNKFHRASKWKCSGNLSLGSFFLPESFLDDSELDVLCLARASCSVVLPVSELTLLLAICPINLWTRCQMNSLSHCRSSAGEMQMRWEQSKTSTNRSKGVLSVAVCWA